jgi:hypothetical protein
MLDVWGRNAEMILSIILMVLMIVITPSLEIWFDHSKWKNNKNDKHISTVLRFLFFAAISLISDLTGLQTWYYTFMLVSGSFLSLFDQGLNVTRWKIISKLRGVQYSDRNLPRWIVSVFVFFRRLCYHSNRGTDRIYSKIPPYIEILGKIGVLITVIYVYLNY